MPSRSIWPFSRRQYPHQVVLYIVTVPAMRPALLSSVSLVIMCHARPVDAVAPSLTTHTGPGPFPPAHRRSPAPAAVPGPAHRYDRCPAGVDGFPGCPRGPGSMAG
ncbi:hypothetical protein GCM10010341_01780 [Streptomyces noursei]|nr:hypothetical protein GCM10010341_01780 [Streptomyces noursei]